MIYLISTHHLNTSSLHIVPPLPQPFFFSSLTLQQHLHLLPRPTIPAPAQQLPTQLRSGRHPLVIPRRATHRRSAQREQLLRHVWDSEPEWQGVGTVSEHVHRLRAKVEVDPAKPCHILTVRGVGYTIREP